MHHSENIKKNNNNNNRWHDETKTSKRCNPTNTAIQI